MANSGDGGQVFNVPPSFDPHGTMFWPNLGVTARDLAAIHLAAALVNHSLDPATIATMSYDIAQAMIDEKYKRD